MVLDTAAPAGRQPLDWRTVPDPQPGPRHLRVRVACCGVCRTDLHIIEGDLPLHRSPLIPGHQVVGIVDQLGPECSRFQVGRRVGIAWLARTCGQCRFCQTQRENLCERAAFTGYDTQGGYAPLAVVHEDFAYAIPDAFTDVEAAPLLCAGIIGYRSLARARPTPGCRLGLVGFGSSAHIVMRIARARGYEVYVATRHPDHQQLARDMGAAWVGDDPARFPVKLDSAILFAPAGRLVAPMLAALDKGGTLAVAGIHLTPIPALDYAQHLYHERDLRSVTNNTRDDGRSLLDEAARIKLKPRVSTYRLRDANRALADLASDRVTGSAVLVMDD